MNAFLLMAVLLQQPQELRIEKALVLDTRIGPPRAGLTVHPMETVNVRFDVAGVKANDKGERRLEFTFTVTDGDGKEILKDAKGEGGGADLFPPSVMPIVCYFRLPEEKLKGPIKVSFTAKDLVAGLEVKKDVPLELLPADLAIVNARVTLDAEGEMVRPPVCVVGEMAMVHFDAVALKKKDGAVWLQQDLEILDAATGKRLSFQEKLLDHKEQAETAVVSARHPFLCGRAGRFTYKIVVRDMNDGGRKVEKVLTIEVREQ